MEVVASLSQGRTAVRSAACLHTNQSRSYLNHLVYKMQYLEVSGAVRHIYICRSAAKV